ncbi:MobV family relaxase [Anabaena sp. PCC 7108]|uniref:MobV family relaxase n=1 Tax=Anabaena sp. PCC 7108 TaxID=163908 RepID=UPI000347C38A|nr:MobV family relaxase [Anabaena sp. PCC 7108]
MVALAILRIDKLKSFTNVSGSEAHTARLQDTPNADTTKDNIRLIGDDDGLPLEVVIKAKIASTTKHKPRKDAVLCTELFLSASPKYFRPDDPSKVGQWDDNLMWAFAQTSAQWLQDKYGDKCVRAELHLDESTPHIHAYVVPINDNTQQLSHKEMFGGHGRAASIKLSKLQDSYAAALAPLGISRGVKGSQATHTKIQEYYQAVNSEPLTLELDRLAPKPKETAQQLFNRIQADPVIQTINHQLADRKLLSKQQKQAFATALASEKLRQQLEQQVSALQAENKKLQQQVEQLSDLSLEDVAWHLGLDQDNSSYRCWRRGEHIIYINGSQWSHLAPNTQKTDAIAGAVNIQKTGAIAGAITGTGAVALVKHINGCNFREAIAWLNDRFGEEGMQRAVTHYARQQAQKVIQEQEAPQFVPPVPDKSNWHLVHDYLTKKRRLPQDLLQKLYQWGLVYADNEQNAVFLLKNLNGETKGAFLQGTRAEDNTLEENNTFTGYAIGTKRTDGWFYLQWGGQPTDEIQKVVLLKSPLDVLSFAMLEVERHRGVPEERIMYMTVDSPRSLPVDLLQDIPEVICAYDNDSAGDEMAGVVSELLPQATRVKPQTQNWHEELLVLLRWQQREREYQQRQKQQRQRERKRESELEL